MAKMKEYELSYKDELMGIYNDMHKDAHGFRPRGILWEQANDMTVEELTVELRRLEAIIVEDMEREKAYKNEHMAAIAAAEADPNGYVWEGDYDYYADTTKHGYVVPAAPANDAMAAAFARADA